MTAFRRERDEALAELAALKESVRRSVISVKSPKSSSKPKKVATLTAALGDAVTKEVAVNAMLEDLIRERINSMV